MRGVSDHAIGIVAHASGSDLDPTLVAAHADSPLVKRHLPVALCSDLHFISRCDDNSRLVSIMKRPVLWDVGFRAQNPR